VDKALEDITATSANYKLAEPVHQTVQKDWFAPKFTPNPETTTSVDTQQQTNANYYQPIPEQAVSVDPTQPNITDEDLRKKIRIGQVLEVIEGIHVEQDQANQGRSIDISQLGAN
jgi:hypothetical protein